LNRRQDKQGAVLLKARRSLISESPPRTARKLRGAIEERSAAAIMGFFPASGFSP